MDWKLAVVVLPVSDVDRSKTFYSEQLGFGVDVDVTPAIGVRIVQMTPPGSGCSITFGTGLSPMEPGSLKGLQLTVSDIVEAHDTWSENGVAATPIRHVVDGEWLDGHGGPWNSFVFFDDPDGNSWAVQEAPTPSE